MRQLALLHFRNTITLSVKLEEALARAHARVPPAIVQMLLVLQVGTGPGSQRQHLRGGVGPHASQRGRCQEELGREELCRGLDSGEGWPQPGPMHAQQRDQNRSCLLWAGS